MMTGETEKVNKYINLKETKQKILRVAEKKYQRKPEKLGMIHAAHILKNIPAADVAPVIHARWEPYHEADFGWDEYGVRCTNCKPEVENKDFTFPGNFCPRCGAKMDGGARHAD